MNSEAIKQALLESYRSHGGTNHVDGVNLPSQESVNQLAVDCMHLLFPGYFEERGLSDRELPAHVERLLKQIEERLVSEIGKCLRFAKRPEHAARAGDLTNTFLRQL